MTGDPQDELRARLREAAEARRPDRMRILARVERGMSEQVRTGRRARRQHMPAWLRVAGAGAAAAGVLAVGGYAVASVVKEVVLPPQGPVAVSPTLTPSPEATSGPSASPSDPASAPASPRPGGDTDAPAPSTPASGSPSSAPAVPSTAAPGVENGPLWSDGSVDPGSNEFWAQSNVTLKTTTDLTALTVRLKIAQTGGVTSTGTWRSLPEQDFTLAVEERDGFLVYTWVLKPDRTVRPGEWVFAGQYDHRQGGRDAADDRYTVTATSTSTSKELGVAGDFAPQGSN
ncbi:hypothetical protein [Streptomyces sp. NPDC127039]|uniref:hypothetical protein n=1 Tax=Streptomyces sp. NPDC127039 TaxID=3347115 RepID=UPI00366625DB